MNTKKGIQRVKSLRYREKERRGKPAGSPEALRGPEATSLRALREEYLSALLVRNYSEQTVEGRRDGLNAFLQWASDRDLVRPEAVTRPILESYQRHLYRYRKKNGKPLGSSSQRARTSVVKDFFRWLVKSNYLLHNPASEIELPRPEKRLPKAPLSVGEVEAALSVPDIADPLGLRDRAILETIYSTGMRRCELVAIELADLNIERRTIHIRKGKGKKERVVPAGERALEWIERYIEEGRPRLLVDPNEKTLFLTAYGEPFNPDFLSHHVRKIVKKSDTGRDGSCHLFRHSCATHMLENGADIRVIQQLLGHSKLESTQIYTEVSIRHLQEVHARTHPGYSKSGRKGSFKA